MTTKDAILKLANAVSGNTSANVATDVQALAVLAQAMTGGAPAEPLATVDDAIGYIADNYSGGGGGGASTQTLTVTKGNESNTVSVYTISWSDYIAHNNDARVEVQPDSTDGLISVYSIPVGTAFIASISGGVVGMYLNAEMTIPLNCPSMPSTPLYAKSEY